MLSHLIKRLLFIPFILLIISFITFCLISLAPSDPAEVILRVNNIQVTPLAIEQVNQEFGLNQPFFYRYLCWLKSALSLDFGNSYITKESVSTILTRAMLPTLYLVSCVVLITICLSIPIGILLARNANKLIDKIGRFITFSFVGTPDYWIGLLLIWLISVKLNWLPMGKMDSTSSVILPTITLSLAYIGLYVKLIRNTILEQLPQYYVLYAKARGLKNSLIMNKHIMINAIQSSLVVFGMSIPRLIAGTVIIENIFAWPGMGRACVTAIYEHDYPVLQAYILLISLLYLIFNLLIDMVQIYINPKLRYNNG